jgi:small-conductance mechanosensitive channel
VWQLAERIFPVLPAGQREGWLGYLTLAIMALVASMLAGRARQRLPVRGLIPRGVGTLQLGLRALVILLALTAIARLLPRPFRPAIPWVVLAAAAAVGWSARDFLPDAFAAAFMVVERRIRPGRWVTGSGFEGEVEAIGVRATRLRDAEGRTVLVPNRTLLAAPVTTESSRRPIMEVAIRAPAGLDPLVVRRAIEDAALLSPWRALDHQPDVRRDGENATLWRVRVRLLEARFLKSFQSALVDHVEQMLAPSKAGCGPDARAT